MEIDDDGGLVSTEMAPQTTETDESEQGDSVEAPSAFDPEENVIVAKELFPEQIQDAEEFRTVTELTNSAEDDTVALVNGPVNGALTDSPSLETNTRTASEAFNSAGGHTPDEGQRNEAPDELPPSGTFHESRDIRIDDPVAPTAHTTTSPKPNSDASHCDAEDVASQNDLVTNSQSTLSPPTSDGRPVHPRKKVIQQSYNDSAAHQPEQLHQSSVEKLTEEMPPNIHPPEEKLLDVIIERQAGDKRDDGSVEGDLVPIMSSRATSVGSPENSMLAMGAPSNLVAAPQLGTQVVSTVQPGHSFYSVHHTGHMPVPTAIFAPISAPMNPTAPAMTGAPGGRRKIVLRLEEDVSVDHGSGKKGFFFRRRTPRSFLHSGLRQLDGEPGVKRGKISVSWFEGTSSTELQEHVRRSVVRKMELDRSIRLDDMRIIDESMDPPEEIVLSPYIPDGSEFLLRFSTKPAGQQQPSQQIPQNTKNVSQFQSQASTGYSVPVSPSAAPSPFPSNAELNRLNEQLLQARLGTLKPPALDDQSREGTEADKSDGISLSPSKLNGTGRATEKKEDETAARLSEVHEGDYAREDQVEQRLRQLADLLASDRKQVVKRQRREKRQVVFVLANYFVLFLSLIAIMAEVQARLPGWAASMEKQLSSVQKCAKDQDALFECVSKGDFAGLMAALVLTVSRSPATNRLLLFGFDTPKRLWTVVYEAMVTAICWGASYMFIRRGMNPDTRKNFLRKYWKDAVYGSLAGFNASFLKAVLKNLIPQEALEDALQERQLKILSWLPSFH